MNKLLKDAIIEQLGYNEETDAEELADTLSDISQYGADNGVSGFIYYYDTCQFYDDNKRLILEHAAEMAEELGEGLSTMIAGFNCLKNYKEKDVVLFLAGLADDSTTTQIKNALAWFVLEELAHEEN